MVSAAFKYVSQTTATTFAFLEAVLIPGRAEAAGSVPRGGTGRDTPTQANHRQEDTGQTQYNLRYKLYCVEPI